MPEVRDNEDDETTTTTTRSLHDDGDGVTVTAAPSGVLTLRVDRGSNVFNPSLNSALSAALDVVEQREHPKALVVTGVGKFFSNGLDLEFLGSNDDASSMIEGVWRVLARLLVMDCRTVAAVNGHAFGAGLFLALACDHRLMRTRRGYLNWPEVNLGMPLSEGFAALTRAKVTDPRVLRDGVLGGRRYDSAAAAAAGLVDEECDVDRLLARATATAELGMPSRARWANFSAESFRAMKTELYPEAYRALAFGSVDSADRVARDERETTTMRRRSRL